MLVDQDLEVKVADNAHLDVTVAGGAITGHIPRGAEFGNWPAPEGEDPSPSVRDVEKAVGEALGLTLFLEKRNVADSGAVTFTFLIPAPADGGLENLLADIRDASRKTDETESKWEAAKAKVKECKAQHDIAISNLRRLNKTLCEPLAPLFAFGQSQADDGWRKVSIREALLGLTPKTYDLFDEAGLDTMGDYSDFCAKGKSARDIKGVGEDKLSKISDAEVAFWASRKGK